MKGVDGWVDAVEGFEGAVGAFGFLLAAFDLAVLAGVAAGSGLFVAAAGEVGG